MACPSSMAMGENGEDEVIHVLAVDDDRVNLITLETLLKSSSCKVTTAENGMRALEYLGLLGDDQHKTPNTNVPKINLIITDYSMPGINGYQLLKKVKESAMLKDVPVVVMSSSNNVPSRINQCLEEGALMFMPKPLNHSDVKHLISQLR